MSVCFCRWALRLCLLISRFVCSKSDGSSTVAVAKELLHNTIAASRELGRNRDKIPLWEQMLAKMPEYMHSSQLYPLFDGVPEEIARNPELRAAFRKSIEYKLDKHWKNNQRGFMSFGLVQLGQAATSLGDGELAYHYLKHLVNRFWLNNLASMHNHRSLFNMDISGGMPAVVIKMLAASEPGRIQLLPALPRAWPAGTIEGVLCRGQIEIRSLQWSPGKVLASLKTARKQRITLDLPWDITHFAVNKGDAPIERGNNKKCLVVTLPAEQEVTLEIRTDSRS